MRIIYLWSLSLLVLFFSGISSAYAADFYWRANASPYPTGSSPSAACRAYLDTKSNPSGNYIKSITISGAGGTCYWGVYINTSLTYTVGLSRFGDSCPSGKTYNETTGICEDNQPDPCLDRQGQATPYFEQFPSYDSYQSNCKVSVDGCQVDVCSGAAATCGSKSTGEFACWGSGTFTGSSSDGTENPTSPPDPESPPPPTTTDNSSSCTAPQVNNGTTSYTCVNESNSSQFADSNCSVGTVNGVTALHCTKPDYVPEADNKTVTDQVTETTNPDGSKTTTTESTTNRTTCKAGECTTTTTTTTTTTVKDSAGNTTDETTECQGDKCDNPATPEDESEEEEEVERTVSGDDCAGTLSCEGDAIDCAVLKQQKLMRCSMDWETQKGAVIAEAAKPEYQLETEEIDASGFFNGPSAARWLTASCPADRVIHLQTTGTSITFSWDFVCQYASGLGNLLVALASLFFAVYVGRAFGGS